MRINEIIEYQKIINDSLFMNKKIVEEELKKLMKEVFDFINELYTSLKTNYHTYKRTTGRKYMDYFVSVSIHYEKRYNLTAKITILKKCPFLFYQDEHAHFGTKNYPRFHLFYVTNSMKAVASLKITKERSEDIQMNLCWHNMFSLYKKLNEFNIYYKPYTKDLIIDSMDYQWDEQNEKRMLVSRGENVRMLYLFYPFIKNLNKDLKSLLISGE